MNKNSTNVVSVVSDWSWVSSPIPLYHATTLAHTHISDLYCLAYTDLLSPGLQNYKFHANNKRGQKWHCLFFCFLLEHSHSQSFLFYVPYHFLGKWSEMWQIIGMLHSMYQCTYYCANRRTKLCQYCFSIQVVCGFFSCWRTTYKKIEGQQHIICSSTNMACLIYCQCNLQLCYLNTMIGVHSEQLIRLCYISQIF